MAADRRQLDGHWGGWETTWTQGIVLDRDVSVMLQFGYWKRGMSVVGLLGDQSQ